METDDKMMSQEEFQRICAYMKGRYGINLSNRKEIVSGRLANTLRIGGWRSYDELMDAVERDSTGNLDRKLVDILTTNHTYFMREPEHFDFLRREVLPYLKQREERSKDLNIWCAAASTGEEPYTIAMTIIDYLGLEHGAWDTTVLATDLSTEVLQRAARGIYTAEQVKSLPDVWRRRFFRRLSGESLYEAALELKNQVLFRKFNLMDDFPFKRKMHIIFLRNVMIYFDAPTKRNLIDKIYHVMEPGGYLFIGQTETLETRELSLHMVYPSVFRKSNTR